MRFGIAVLIAAGILMGAIAPASGISPADNSLQGVWHLSSGEADGKILSESQLKDGKLIIQDAHYTVTLPQIGTLTGTQKLGATAEHKTIDITEGSGANPEKTCLGIYELNGNEFRVVFASPGAPRPTTFTTSPSSGQWMHVWNRVQK